MNKSITLKHSIVRFLMAVSTWTSKVKDVLSIINIFLFRFTSKWNEKWTRKHRTFCKIHDTFVVICIILAAYCLFAACGTIEQSNTIGSAWIKDCFTAAKYTATFFVLASLIGSANNAFWDEDDWDEDEDY